MDQGVNRRLEITRAIVVSDGVVSATVKATSLYEQRKLDHQCLRCGVDLPDDLDDDLCPEHRADKRERDARSQVRRHAERRERGECAYCARLSETFRCAACAVRQKRVPKSGIDTGKGKSDRIAARIIAWENSPTNAGRKRLRGGDRGRRSIGDENRSDFDLIEKEIVEARKGDAYAWGPDVQSLPRIQRQAVVLAVGDRVAMAKRMLEEILRRLKHPAAPQIVVSEDDDET